MDKEKEGLADFRFQKGVKIIRANGVLGSADSKIFKKKTPTEIFFSSTFRKRLENHQNYGGESELDKPFEPVLGNFTDRAYVGGLFPGTKIPTDLAAPDGEGEYGDRAG